MKKTPKMSSLTTAANAASQYTEEGLEEEVHDDNTPTQESPMSKASNQDMETDGSEDLGKHLDKLINKVENEEDLQDEEISFRGGQSLHHLPELSWYTISALPIYLISFGHPSEFQCHQHQAMPLMPCLMHLTISSQR